MTPSRLVLVLLVTTGCGGPERRGAASDPSGGRDADGPAEIGSDAGLPVTPPTPPTLPEPPELADWACPDGWDAPEIGSGEPWAVRTCQPPARLDCGPGEVQPLGAAGCVRLGTECPADGFLPEEAIRGLAPGFDGRLVYVRPGDQDPADGSRERPFRCIWDALPHASDGVILALAPGSYAEQFSLPTATAVVGSCVTGTVVRQSLGNEMMATVYLAGAGGSERAPVATRVPPAGTTACRTSPHG